MKEHLKNWWLAYGSAAVAIADKAWPSVRGYICTHPTLAGGAFLTLVVTALIKESPLTKNL